MNTKIKKSIQSYFSEDEFAAIENQEYVTVKPVIIIRDYDENGHRIAYVSENQPETLLYLNEKCSSQFDAQIKCLSTSCKSLTIQILDATGSNI